MIPPERALVCAHPTLVELPKTSVRDFRRSGVGCPACSWQAWIPIPPHPFPSGMIYVDYRSLHRWHRMNNYIGLCVGLTFGERWAAHIRWTRLVQAMTTGAG